MVSEDIADFEYTPRPEFEGPFVIMNEENEKALVSFNSLILAPLQSYFDMFAY